MGARSTVSTRLLVALVAGASACGVGAGGLTDDRDAAPRGAGPSDSAATEAACVSGDPGRQRYGSACLCCHSDEFSVAGSVDLGGPAIVRVLVTDARGEIRDMAPNSFGNFFRHFALTPPLRAVAYDADGRASAMRDPAPHGDCNACHGLAGTTRQIHGP